MSCQSTALQPSEGKRKLHSTTTALWQESDRKEAFTNNSWTLHHSLPDSKRAHAVFHRTPDAQAPTKPTLNRQLARRRSAKPTPAAPLPVTQARKRRPIGNKKPTAPTRLGQRTRATDRRGVLTDRRTHPAPRPRLDRNVGEGVKPQPQARPLRDGALHVAAEALSKETRVHSRRAHRELIRHRRVLPRCRRRRPPHAGPSCTYDPQQHGGIAKAVGHPQRNACRQGDGRRANRGGALVAKITAGM
jgi:hypothetical protein